MIPRVSAVSSQRCLADKARQTTSCSCAVCFCPGDSFLLHSGTRRSAFRRGRNFYFIITAVHTRQSPSCARAPGEKPAIKRDPPPPPLLLLCAPLSLLPVYRQVPTSDWFRAHSPCTCMRCVCGPVPPGVKPRAPPRWSPRPSRPDACRLLSLWPTIFRPAVIERSRAPTSRRSWDSLAGRHVLICRCGETARTGLRRLDFANLARPIVRDDWSGQVSDRFK